MKILINAEYLHAYLSHKNILFQRSILMLCNMSLYKLRSWKLNNLILILYQGDNFDLLWYFRALPSDGEDSTQSLLHSGDRGWCHPSSCWIRHTGQRNALYTSVCICKYRYFCDTHTYKTPSIALMLHNSFERSFSNQHELMFWFKKMNRNFRKKPYKFSRLYFNSYI